ncbi:hypothetical protein NMG60_11012571 [Bertholletia excelsa]
MKKCELCNYVARMYCESDRAILCWDCDAKVHAANFLVAKHTRTLLCHACQAPTPWKGSGAKLAHTVSVCEGCVRRSDTTSTIHHGDDGDLETDSESQEEEEEEEEEEGEGEEGDGNSSDDGDNQVVPLFYNTVPPRASSSSSSEESSGRATMGASVSIGFSLKPTRH